MKGKINELPNIDTSRYSIDENGNVLRDSGRMTENQLFSNMSIQEDVLKLRIENEQLKKENKTLKDREEGFKKQIIGLCEKYYQVYERFPELKDSFLLGDRVVEENEQLKEKIKNVREKLFNLLSEYEIGNYDSNIHQFYKDVYEIHNALMELEELQKLKNKKNEYAKTRNIKSVLIIEKLSG